MTTQLVRDLLGKNSGSNAEILYPDFGMRSVSIQVNGVEQVS